MSLQSQEWYDEDSECLICERCPKRYSKYSNRLLLIVVRWSKKERSLFCEECFEKAKQCFLAVMNEEDSKKIVDTDSEVD